MSMDREAEIERLNLSERHIAEAERHIMEQQLIVGQLRGGGHDTQEAERLLKTMESVLDTYQVHRRLIVEMIDQIDAGQA